MRFTGPLTEARLDALRQKDIKILERLNGSYFTVRLTPRQVDWLSTQAFVDEIRLYDRTDTLNGDSATMITHVSMRGTDTYRFTRLFGVRLHRPEDMASVVGWLGAREIKPIVAHADLLQVALPQDSQILRALADVAEVAAIDELQLPRTLDRMARQILKLEKAGKSVLGLEGQGQIIGIADTGLDDQHPDFAGRIAGITTWGRAGDHSDPEGHGTHVAGCAAGDGHASKGEVRGAVPKAKIFFQSILDAKGMLGGLPADLGSLFEEAYQCSHPQQQLGSLCLRSIFLGVAPARPLRVGSSGHADRHSRRQ